ncbi:MAG: hypothetical protein H6581_31005 [Bacteroidia bacterium]|nr:hypothetical protein [Bacteroidia bacterium]
MVAKISLIFSLLLGLSVTLQAGYGSGVELDPLISPVNGREVKPVATGETFFFLAAGHIFGAPGNSAYPSPNLLVRMDELNQSGAAFFMSLGDNYRQMDSLHMGNFKTSFVQRLQLPLFNSLGNHDLMPHRFNDYWGKDYEAYTSVFGPPWYRFRVGESLFLILDTEEEVWKVTDDQLKFFRKTLDVECDPAKGIRNLFIFSHKMLWNNPEYGNFRSTLFPILKNAAQRVKINWFSGDLPAHPMVWRREPGLDITYYAIALADDENDLMARVWVEGNGNVRVEPVSLTGKPAPPLDSLYSEDILPEEWARPVDVVLPPKEKPILHQILSHNYFWKGVMAGAGIMLILLLLILWIRRR